MSSFWSLLKLCRSKIKQTTYLSTNLTWRYSHTHTLTKLVDPSLCCLVYMDRFWFSRSQKFFPLYKEEHFPTASEQFNGRDNSGSWYHERKSLIQPKLERKFEFSVRNFRKIFCGIFISVWDFFSHLAHFNEIFGMKWANLSESPQKINPAMGYP